MLLPPPPIEPFQRLQVTNGLLLTAERWQQAHNYHRQRQNIYYQSLHQAGIVWGLGVCLIPPPDEVASEYRDRRWLQIQPGLAIDRSGNPIVVPQAIAFRIASLPPASDSLTVYVSVSYVGPERLQEQGNCELVQETFRIDETIAPPQDGEVELCRILLQPGEVQLQSAIDVLAPGANNLDLRYRQQAQPQFQEGVQVALVAQGQTPQATSIVAALSYLLQSVAALYPAMRGIGVTQVTLQPADANLGDADLLYLSYQQILALTEAERETLRQYLTAGAVVLVEISVQEAKIAEISSITQQLRAAIANLNYEPGTEEIRRELETELTASDAHLTQQLLAISLPIREIAQQLGMPTETSEPLSRNHPLRHQPFLFAQLPLVQNQPTYLFNWGGIVLAIGSLSSAWGLDETLSLPRETIRSAQEIGINVLHFAWRRHHLTQLGMRNERSGNT